MDSSYGVGGLEERSWFTVGEVSDLLDISKSAVSRLLRVEKMPGDKVAGVWRVSTDEFYRWVEHYRQDPKKLKPVRTNEVAVTSRRLWLTPGQVAESLKIGDETVNEMLEDKMMPGYKIGEVWRIDETELDQWIASQRNTSVKPGQAQL